MKYHRIQKKILAAAFGAVLSAAVLLSACGRGGAASSGTAELSGGDIFPENGESAGSSAESASGSQETVPIEPELIESSDAESSAESQLPEPESEPESAQSEDAPASSVPEQESGSEPVSTQKEPQQIGLDPDWTYASFSKINSGMATLYFASPDTAKDRTVCINAGHGTSGGGSVKTQCHPDGTPKVTGGTTGEGATEATAVSSGMEFLDGTTEAAANLKLALRVKERLLAEGYNVLMIRESDDVQLDNIARTVIANNCADCHIAIHYDSTDRDKGVFFMSVPNDASYRAMVPVSTVWQEHERLGYAVVNGIAGQGFALFDNGALEMDLTQTSYSTIPSIDLEVGDKASDHSDERDARVAEGIVAGVNAFFGN